MPNYNQHTEKSITEFCVKLILQHQLTPGNKFYISPSSPADRPGLRNVDEIKRLNQAVLQTLQRELIQRPPASVTQPTRADVSVLSKLLNKRHGLRYVNILY